MLRKSALAIIILILVVSPVWAEGDINPAFVVPVIDTVVVENLVFDRINSERINRGLSPLLLHDSLARLAKIQSGNMAKYDFLSHTDQNGDTPGKRRARYFPKLFGGIGENIELNSGTSPEDAAERLMKSWLNSSGHRANILDRSYSHVGVGVVQQGGYIYATQVFGDLIASLETDVPEVVPYGTEITLRFKYESVFPGQQLTVFADYPDPSARCYLPDGTYYSGTGPCTPLWDGNSFSITLKLDKGKGVYKIKFGRNGNYYRDGLLIKVE